MSLLYKPQEEITYSVTIVERKEEDNLVLTFYCDGGKFGTHEVLDEYNLTPLRLLEILQERDDYTEDEIN